MRSTQTPRKVLMEQLQAAHEHVRALESRTHELERTEKFLRTVFEAAPDATAIVDRQGTFMLVNAHVEQLFGYSRDELLGQPFELLLPAEYTGVAPRHTNGDPSQEGRTGTSPGGLGRGELRAIRKDGTEFFVDLTLSPIAIETGGLVVASIRDASAPRLERQALRSTLHRQEMMLREVHHRVKNNLNAIAILLSLQSARSSNPETVSAVQESEARVRSAILLHDQLHRSTDFGRIALAPYVRSLVGHLAHVHGANAQDITLDVEAEEVFLPVDQAVPCGLIIQELVSNALKHAFPEGRAGAVRIAVHLTGESRCQLSVADNGVGFPADLDFYNPTSLGLELVHNLTGQLNGCFQLETGQGCRFVVSFPFREPEQ